jgi:hypothetical protein
MTDVDGESCHRLPDNASFLVHAHLDDAPPAVGPSGQEVLQEVAKDLEGHV